MQQAPALGLAVPLATHHLTACLDKGWKQEHERVLVEQPQQGFVLGRLVRKIVE